jgi:DNA (cytosine-5)-methyltransferase 1
MSQVAVSLFSGCMGLDLGLEAAGVRTAVAVENDPACQATIRANRPGVALFADARTVTGERLRAAAGGHVDILAGGPPCQSFSTIGASRSLNDDRGDLVGQFLRLLGEVNPRLFVFENVPGITSLGMQPDGRRPWPWLLGQFRGLGYAVNWWQLDAVNYGSPQRRARVIAMGAADGAAPPRPTPIPGVMTLRDAIGAMEQEPGECAHFTPKMAKMMTLVPPGGNWRSLPPGVREEAIGGANQKSGGLTSYYRRLSYDRPSPTLLTSPTQRGTTLCHPAVTRPLSVAEYARIQGFPDEWQFIGTMVQKYRMIGNAVPVPLGEAIGHSLSGNQVVSSEEEPLTLF